MTHLRTTILLLVLTLIFIFTGGCSSIFDEKSPDTRASQIPGQTPASYKVTLNQPDAQSGYLKMDSDVYNIGEVVEFTVTNEGSRTLECAGNPPSFSVKFQAGNGIWATRMGTEEPDASKRSTLAPGASTQVYRFVTTGWDPGRYRIVHDCGIEREILIRALPPATPAPVACPADNATGTTPWITVDPVGDQYAARSFTIHGTTNLPAGQELNYLIFAVPSQGQVKSHDNEGTFTTLVQDGSCGINTWSARGEIQAAGEFAIGITDAERSTSAIRRFTVLPP